MCRFCVSDVQGLDDVIHHPGYDGGFTALIKLLENLDCQPEQFDLFDSQPNHPNRWEIRPYTVYSDVEDLPSLPKPVL